jgi:hypothetical protein
MNDSDYVHKPASNTVEGTGSAVATQRLQPIDIPTKIQSNNIHS